MSLGTKLANGVAGGTIGWVLALTGFVANELQGSSATTGIVSLFAWAPFVLIVIVMILMILFYHYDDEVETVLSDLEARKHVGV